MTQRDRLENARHGLMRVHRALLEAERIRYERIHGRVDGSGAFLQIAIHDPWFAWLGPISELIVQIDEWLDEDPPTPCCRTIRRWRSRTPRRASSSMR